MADDDPFQLSRFVQAQAAPRDGHEDALRQLAAGAKTGHWMWYVFPQLRGLGRTEFAVRFGLSGLAEAQAYVRHPVLGERLRACCAQLDRAPPGTAIVDALRSDIDTLKLKSCLTLFEQADPADPIYARLLDRFYAGERDARTLGMLER